MLTFNPGRSSYPQCKAKSTTITALQANRAPEAPALGTPVREKLPPKLEQQKNTCVKMSVKLERNRKSLHKTIDSASKIGDDEGHRSCRLGNQNSVLQPSYCPRLTHFSFYLSTYCKLSQHVEQKMYNSNVQKYRQDEPEPFCVRVGEQRERKPNIATR